MRTGYSNGMVSPRCRQKWTRAGRSKAYYISLPFSQKFLWGTSKKKLEPLSDVDDNPQTRRVLTDMVNRNREHFLSIIDHQPPYVTTKPRADRSDVLHIIAEIYTPILKGTYEYLTSYTLFDVEDFIQSMFASLCEKGIPNYHPDIKLIQRLNSMTYFAFLRAKRSLGPARFANLKWQEFDALAGIAVDDPDKLQGPLRYAWADQFIDEARRFVYFINFPSIVLEWYGKCTDLQREAAVLRSRGHTLKRCGEITGTELGTFKMRETNFLLGLRNFIASEIIRYLIHFQFSEEFLEHLLKCIRNRRNRKFNSFFNLRFPLNPQFERLGMDLDDLVLEMQDTREQFNRLRHLCELSEENIFSRFHEGITFATEVFERVFLICRAGDPNYDGTQFLNHWSSVFDARRRLFVVREFLRNIGSQKWE